MCFPLSFLPPSFLSFQSISHDWEVPVSFLFLSFLTYSLPNKLCMFNRSWAFFPFPSSFHSLHPFLLFSFLSFLPCLPAFIHLFISPPHGETYWLWKSNLIKLLSFLHFLSFFLAFIHSLYMKMWTTQWHGSFSLIEGIVFFHSFLRSFLPSIN